MTHHNLYSLTLTTEFDDPKKCKHMMISLISDYHTENPYPNGFKNGFQLIIKIW